MIGIIIEMDEKYFVIKKNIMDMYKMSKMSPKDFFYQYAQKQGIDPDQFINSLR